MAKSNGAAPKATGTEYTVMISVSGPDGTPAWMPFPSEKSSFHSNQGGVGAIKQATKREDGSHEPGTFKAVPTGTWESETNNLVIETTQQTVSTFTKPKKGNVSHEPARTPDPA